MTEQENCRPVQQRSINTRNKIMEAALELYAQRGYHNVTVDEIAAAAGVSTGIAYRYFRNKRDLLLNSISSMAERIQQVTGTQSAQLEEFHDPAELIRYVLKQFEELHCRYYAFHEELEGLRHTDPDVKRIYDETESAAIDRILPELIQAGYDRENLRERLCLSLSVLENCCHMQLDPKYADMDHEFLRETAVAMVLKLLIV